ncbi:hypothetical protein C4J81_05335 [Deltaproteobacteria bacterium Smac51]|nr:hypothetical protein C4J81_05335 [Deltaproteobacteria bacterium Smac51]
MTPIGSRQLCRAGAELHAYHKKDRKEQIDYGNNLYKQRHKIEIIFGRLKDWRGIATRYERYAHTFFSAICITASISPLTRKRGSIIMRG